MAPTDMYNVNMEPTRYKHARAKPSQTLLKGISCWYIY